MVNFYEDLNMFKKKKRKKKKKKKKKKPSSDPPLVKWRSKHIRLKK